MKRSVQWDGMHSFRNRFSRVGNLPTWISKSVPVVLKAMFSCGLLGRVGKVEGEGQEIHCSVNLVCALGSGSSS